MLSGGIVWPIAAARDVLEHYAEHAASYSDEMYLGPALMTMPDGTEVIGMDVVYNGDPKVGEKELEALRAVATPMMDGCHDAGLHGHADTAR